MTAGAGRERSPGLKNKTEITLSLPKEVNMEGKTKLEVSGEAETFFGTRFHWMISFTTDAVVQIMDQPGKDARPEIKPLRLSINKRHKVLFAKVGPEKIEVVPGKSKSPRQITIHILNSEPEIEQMIFDLSRM